MLGDGNAGDPNDPEFHRPIKRLSNANSIETYEVEQKRNFRQIVASTIDADVVVEVITAKTLSSN